MKSWLIPVVAVSVVALLLFGFVGFRSVWAVVLLFVFPVLIILNKLKFDPDEKVFFSLFIGLGLFPLAVWYVNQVLPSFRLSLVLVLVLAFAFLFWHTQHKKPILSKPEA